MKKNKQYKVIASGREQEIGLVVKFLKALEACPGYWICQFVTGNEKIKAGWNTSFTVEELEEV